MFEYTNLEEALFYHEQFLLVLYITILLTTLTGIIKGLRPLSIALSFIGLFFLIITDLTGNEAERLNKRYIESYRDGIVSTTMEIVKLREKYDESQNTIENLIESNKGLSESLSQTEQRLNTTESRLQENSIQISSIKVYSSVAKTNWHGIDEVGLSRLPGIYNEWLKGHVGEKNNLHCEDKDISHFEGVVKRFPEFPFPYAALAICFKVRNNEEWKEYAKKAVAILEITTTINGHSKDHDLALNQMRTMLNK